MSRLDLLDEILSHVFHCLTDGKRLWLLPPKHRLSVLVRKCVAEGGLDVLTSIQLNRRIRRICRPFFARAVSVPHDEEGVSLARALGDQELRRSVLDVEIAVYGKNILPFISLAGFSNPDLFLGLPWLKQPVNLKLTGNHVSHRDNQAEATLDLKLRGSIRRLEIHEWEWSDDAEGTLHNAVTGLEQLDVLDVTLNERFALDDTIPWRSVKHLAIRCETCLKEGVDDFINNLEDACESVSPCAPAFVTGKSSRSSSQTPPHMPPHLPLHRLALDFPLSKPSESGFSHNELVKVLSAVSQTQIRDLVIRRLPLSLSDCDHLKLPSMQRLGFDELEYECDGEKYEQVRAG